LQSRSLPFIDRREVVVTGGRGGDGCISFASIFANEFAGPDGGDGGNGGHVFFKVTDITKKA
jgi:GTP-binding protein